MPALSLDSLPQYGYSSFRQFVPGEKHATRISPEDVLLIVFDGKLRFLEGGIPTEVSSGEYYIQQKNIPHSADLPSDTPYYYYIHFQGSFTEDASRHSLPLRGKADLSLLITLVRKLDTLKLLDASAVETSAAFYAILSALLPHRESQDTDSLVAQITAYCSKQLSEPFSLTALAEECGYCKNHIISVFRRATGYTPYAYRVLCRLDSARNMLLSSSATLETIAAECGFGNYGNFYRSFMSAEGCSPGTWRQLHKQELPR